MGDDYGDLFPRVWGTPTSASSGPTSKEKKKKNGDQVDLFHKIGVQP